MNSLADKPQFDYIEKRNGRIVGVALTPKTNVYTRSIPQPRNQTAKITVYRVQSEAAETELTHADAQRIARERFGTDRDAALEAYTMYDDGYRLNLK